MNKSLTYLLLVLVSCTSPIEIEIVEGKQALVVEAVITNELKQHEIILTKSVKLDEFTPGPVLGASVSVRDDKGKQFDFIETENGRYVSLEAFSAEQGVSYSLSIETTDGQSYQSTEEDLPVATQIDELFGNFFSNPSTEDEGVEEGVQFFINSSSANPASEIFNVRVAFEEDYIITMPHASRYVYSLESGLVAREESIQTCYQNVKSKELLVGTTSGQTQNVLLDFPVRLVKSEEPQLRFRYALTINQYSISPKAFRYYQDLKENNESAGGFSDRQKGSIIGNIVNINDSKETVLGYFEVSNFTQTRQFFTPGVWRDQGFSPTNTFRTCEYSRVADSVFTADIVAGLIDLNGLNIHDISTSQVFTILMPERCTDCRFFGSLDRPDFWE